MAPSSCHPLSQKSQVSAVTFDFLMHTFANRLQLVSCFQGSWVENRAFNQTWDSLLMRSQFKMCWVISLMGPEWVGIQMNLNNDRTSRTSCSCTRCNMPLTRTPCPSLGPEKLRESQSVMPVAVVLSGHSGPAVPHLSHTMTWRSS